MVKMHSLKQRQRRLRPSYGRCSRFVITRRTIDLEYIDCHSPLRINQTTENDYTQTPRVSFCCGFAVQQAVQLVDITDFGLQSSPLLIMSLVRTVEWLSVHLKLRLMNIWIISREYKILCVVSGCCFHVTMSLYSQRWNFFLLHVSRKQIGLL